MLDRKRRVGCCLDARKADGQEARYDKQCAHDHLNLNFEPLNQFLHAKTGARKLEAPECVSVQVMELFLGKCTHMIYRGHGLPTGESTRAVRNVSCSSRLPSAKSRSLGIISPGNAALPHLRATCAAPLRWKIQRFNAWWCQSMISPRAMITRRKCA